MFSLLPGSNKSFLLTHFDLAVSFGSILTKKQIEFWGNNASIKIFFFIYTAHKMLVNYTRC